MKNKLIYALSVFILYLFLGLLIKDSTSGMVSLLLLMPAAVLIISFFYGFMRGFDYMIPIIAMIAFLPIVYGFFNESALVYVLVYGMVALIANFVGGMLQRWIQNDKRKR